MLDKIRAIVLWVLDAAEGLLRGEPARAIGYGGAVVVYLVAKASGKITDLSFAEAVGQTTAATLILITVIETIRHFVSPATVARQ